MHVRTAGLALSLACQALAVEQEERVPLEAPDQRIAELVL